MEQSAFLPSLKHLLIYLDGFFSGVLDKVLTLKLGKRKLGKSE